jgi:hypothetical protein
MSCRARPCALLRRKEGGREPRAGIATSVTRRLRCLAGRGSSCVRRAAALRRGYAWRAGARRQPRAPGRAAGRAARGRRRPGRGPAGGAAGRGGLVGGRVGHGGGDVRRRCTRPAAFERRCRAQLAVTRAAADQWAAAAAAAALQQQDKDEEASEQAPAPAALPRKRRVLQPRPWTCLVRTPGLTIRPVRRSAAARGCEVASMDVCKRLPVHPF